jgi:hypothetical protein
MRGEADAQKADLGEAGAWSVAGRALGPLVEAAEHPLAFPALRAIPRDIARVGILLRLRLVGGAASGAEDQKGGCKESGGGFHHRSIKSIPENWSKPPIFQEALEGKINFLGR